MRLNHLDILEQCFHERLRGYDRKEVDAFLHLIADDFKSIQDDAERLRRELKKKDRLIAELRQGAKPSREELRHDEKYFMDGLKQKAAQMVNVARMQTNLHKHKAEEELNALKKDILRLTQQKESLIENIKANVRVFFTSRKQGQERSTTDNVSPDHEG